MPTYPESPSTAVVEVEVKDDVGGSIADEADDAGRATPSSTSRAPTALLHTTNALSPPRVASVPPRRAVTVGVTRIVCVVMVAIISMAIARVRIRGAVVPGAGRAVCGFVNRPEPISSDDGVAVVARGAGIVPVQISPRAARITTLGCCVGLIPGAMSVLGVL